jgi:hypothetical protein
LVASGGSVEESGDVGHAAQCNGGTLDLTEKSGLVHPGLVDVEIDKLNDAPQSPAVVNDEGAGSKVKASCGTTAERVSHADISAYHSPSPESFAP